MLFWLAWCGLVLFLLFLISQFFCSILESGYLLVWNLSGQVDVIVVLGGGV